MMKKMVGHILVPGFLQISQAKKFILIWNLIIGAPKSAEYIAEPLERHEKMEFKLSTFVHGGIPG